MPYVKPDVIMDQMIQAGTNKGKLGAKDLLIRGILSGALLGFATTLALTGAAQTGVGLVGALIFPVGFVMIVLLGLELVTGNFALVPLGVLEKKITMSNLWFNWSWVFLGNLIGSLLYAVLFAKTLAPTAPLIKTLIAVSEAKTLGYAKLGYDGLWPAFVKAILCNWMVTMGVVMALTSQSTMGKIAAMWLPILTFFAQGFEHSVVNMFVIPAGMIVGANVSFGDWWLWNQIPVTMGNIFGGFVFTGFALYLTHRRTPSIAEVKPLATTAEMSAVLGR
ncbi:MAG TPA: formate/nitrite transporter family protein [Candidatus Binatia bacterium]|nr:formate/nitrite transporter family protein [Candidatus Binatia bacterium]